MKKKNKKPSLVLIVFRNLIVGILVLWRSIVAGGKVADSFKRSERFKIKTVVVDPSLALIASNRLSALKGKSIFAVNLKNLERQLQLQYPEITQLKLIKRFPDQIEV